MEKTTPTFESVWATIDRLAQRQTENERFLKEMWTEDERLRREKWAEDERLYKEKQAEDERLHKERQAEDERLRKKKQAEDECLRKERQAEDERLRKEKQAEDECLRKEKQAEDERLRKEKEAEDERIGKEDERILKEMFAESARQIKENYKQIGGIGNNNGAAATEFFYNSFRYGNKKLFGQQFDDVFKEEQRRTKKGFEDEYDILLFNGQAVCIVEVKYKADTNDVAQTLRKEKTFRANFPECHDKKLYLALASMSFHPKTEEACAKEGIAIIKQMGDTVVIDDKHLIEF
jgi:hypothetical protein